MFKGNNLDDIGLLEMFTDIVSVSEEDEFFDRALAECGHMISDESIDDSMLSESGSAAVRAISREVVKEIREGKRKGKIDRRKCQKIVSDGLKEYAAETFKGKQLTQSAVTTFLVSAIIGINSEVLELTLGGRKAELIADGICAPIVEEIAKFISLKKGYDAQYSVVFNAAEWGLYVNMHASHTGKVSGKFMALRGGIQYLHVIFMNIQRKYFDKAAEMEKEFGKSAKTEVVRYAGLMLAITAHIFWNTSVTLIFREKPKSMVPVVQNQKR